MQFLDIHTHQDNKDPETRSILSLTLTGDTLPALPEGKACSAGLHPWFANMQNFERDYDRLSEFAKKPAVKLIGECGLDRLKGETLEHQLLILKKQILLAEALQKPVILHCVRCYDELMALKKKMQPNVPLIIHGFNKHQELGMQLLAKGFYLSFGKAILNTGSGAASLLKHTDIFFLETDDAPCSIKEIYQAAANLKNSTVAEVKALIFASWKKIKLI